MKEETQNKVYARSNFDLNKVIGANTAPSSKQFNPNSTSLGLKESLNFTPAAPDSDPSHDDNDPEEEGENNHTGPLNHTDEAPSSSASAQGKKRRKKMARINSVRSEYSVKSNPRMQLQQSLSNNGGPPLSREDRKNE